MNWSKYSVEDRKIPGITAFAAILIIASLYMQSRLVLFVAIFFLISFYINHLYLTKVGDRLICTNNIEKMRFFIHDKGKWTLSFANHGVPILKGELTISFDEITSPDDLKIDPSLSLYEINVPFSIFTGQTKNISIPFTAMARGTARIRKLEIRIPSILGFGEVMLENKDRVKQEAIIYPKSNTVHGLKEHQSILQGVNPVPYSVYEDRLGPLGTRDYSPSDSFNRIHWKASARKHELQTKIYERISEKGWNISINVSEGYAVTAMLEQILSSVTEIAYFAFRQQIPYSLCINIRAAGSTPFYYIPKGEGNEHLQRVLETLASINSNHSTFPYDKMLSFYRRHLEVQPTLIHCGNQLNESEMHLFKLSARGIGMLELLIEGEHAVLVPLNMAHGRRKML
jgi:uncharacterized protein (DUF58 family)